MANQRPRRQNPIRIGSTELSPQFLIFMGLGLAFVLAIILIFVTLPSKPANTTNSQPAPPTATPDVSQKLSGKNIEGQILFTRKGFLWGWRGGEGARLAIEPGNSNVLNNAVILTQPAISPAGDMIAYVRQDESFSDLWVVNSNGTNPRPLTENKGQGVIRSENYAESSLWAFSPAWSSDGKQIAYLADRQTDDLALWVVGTARGSQPRRITAFAAGQGGISRPSWSPDGNSIVVAAYENGKPQIFTVRVANGATTKLTNAGDGAYDPAWSPDGKYIAYVNRRGNASDLWVIRADGSSPVQVSNVTARTPVWSPGSDKIAFLGLQNNVFELFVAEFKGTPGAVTQISSGANLDGAGGLSWGK